MSSADDRGLGAGVVFASAHGFLGNDYSNNQAEYFAVFQCLSRALRLHDPHVIFEVDSLLLAKQLARHSPWACRSENLIALHQQCAHVCDSLSALHISWDIRHIYRVRECGSSEVTKLPLTEWRRLFCTESGS